MNRAFSAFVRDDEGPGAMPQAESDTVPLALNIVPKLCSEVSFERFVRSVDCSAVISSNPPSAFSTQKSAFNSVESDALVPIPGAGIGENHLIPGFQAA
jgi:hypothetical protein